jgi:fatty acid desaturase
MPPNAKPFFELSNNNDALIEMLDKQADTAGLSNMNDANEDWTDVKHSERKKRDRILDDGVLIGLMKKSDYRGLRRLFTNLSIMASTIYCIKQQQVFPLNEESFTLGKFLMFLPLYFFYGFQFQCFAFAGQHEFLHRNAFKSKWINDLCLFYTGVFCFEFGKHERVMHKQHHTYTNNVDKDPELTSYYSREILENKAFRNIPLDRISYIRQFLDIPYSWKCRLGRVFNSACGIPVDYSGTGWSLGDSYFTKDSGIMQDLQRTAILQILHWVAFVAYFGQTKEGLQGLVFWWILPVLLGYPVVNYFRNLEHADCEVSKDPNCLRNTRSVRSNLLVRVLLWDTNYHAEHHCYPMVPFYNLHKLNELMYEHVIHKEIDHFTIQNVAAFKVGGWIDQQRAAMDEYTRRTTMMETKKSE